MRFKMTSIGKFKRIKFEPVTVKEPHRYDVKSFADPDEFTEYYRTNEEKFRNISTLALNKTYKIPGYRISLQNKGKENQELILKKDYYGGASAVQSPAAPSPSEDATLNSQLQELTARIHNIEQFLEQLKL